MTAVHVGGYEHQSGTAMRFAIATLPHVFPQTEDPAALDAAHHWSGADAQADLRQQLDAEFDGFAVAVPFRRGIAHSDLWADTRTVLWSSLVPPADPFRRATRATDAVLISTPRHPLYSPDTSVTSQDFLRRGHAVKSAAWTRWVLAHLGAIPGEDTVIDYFTRHPVPAFTTMLTLEGSPA